MTLHTVLDLRKQPDHLILTTRMWLKLKKTSLKKYKELKYAPQYSFWQVAADEAADEPNY